MRTLFLHPPSFDGFDGGAGARYQMKREVRSYWYPTWLAQPAALVQDSKLIDAPPHGLSFADIAGEFHDRDLVVMHTSTPSFKSDIKTAEMIKAINPGIKIGFIGAKVAVEPQKSLIAAGAVDFVARNEFDFTIKEVADGRHFRDIKGLSYRSADGNIVHNEEREILHDMDVLPWVTPVYKRDLTIEKYFGGYLKHPYISFYTGRGCKSRCTFCLWPQTVGGHRYRVRSVEDVVAEMKWAKSAFPQVKEYFFDDDTLTDNLPRVEALARELGKLGVTWSCNAKANVPRKTLEIMKENGLRLLLVGYESGNQQILINIKKGMHVDFARRFTKDCHELGIVIHGTFILGTPGRDQGYDPTDFGFCQRDQSAYDSSLAGRALSRDLPLSSGEGKWLALQRGNRSADPGGDANRPFELSASQPRRDFQFRRGFLPEILFPPEQDCIHRGRDDPESGNDEAPAARGRGVLPLPENTAGRGLMGASVSAVTLPQGPVRRGSDAHKALFCRTLLDTFDPYRPAVIDWPRLDEEARNRLVSLPIWDIAVQTEGRARLNVASYAATVSDPLLRKAVELNAFEEGRHKLVLSNLVAAYGIGLAPEPEYAVPADPEWAFMVTGYSECIDSFFAFGLFETARRSGFFPEELVATFEPVIHEEARHILFFVNWVAWQRRNISTSGDDLFLNSRCWPCGCF